MGDVDEHCRLLGAGCVALHAQLASEAMAASEALPAPGPLDASDALLGRGRGRGRRGATGLDVAVPTLRDLRLGG
jgi:hypothetical protein